MQSPPAHGRSPTAVAVEQCVYAAVAVAVAVDWNFVLVHNRKCTQLYRIIIVLGVVEVFTKAPCSMGATEVTSAVTVHLNFVWPRPPHGGHPGYDCGCSSLELCVGHLLFSKK